MPDPRQARGIRHGFVGIIAVGLAAVLAGARSFVAISEWVTHQSAQTLSMLGVAGAGPTESTIRRVFTRADGDALDQALGAFMWTRTIMNHGRRVIAIDGKTVRGARTRSTAGRVEATEAGRAPHLVAAFDHTAGAVLGQVAVAAKSNEIPAVQRLLGLFDLTGTVVTVDAMHTQTDTARQITTAGGDYVFTVKANQPTLHAACKALPWAKLPAHTSLTRRHGRRTRRTIKVVDAPTWVAFPGAAQLAQIRRTVTRAGKTTVEIVYLITSADHRAAPPATLAALDGDVDNHHQVTQATPVPHATPVSPRQNPRSQPHSHDFADPLPHRRPGMPRLRLSKIASRSWT